MKTLIDFVKMMVKYGTITPEEGVSYLGKKDRTLQLVTRLNLESLAWETAINFHKFFHSWKLTVNQWMVKSPSIASSQAKNPKKRPLFLCPLKLLFPFTGGSGVWILLPTDRLASGPLCTSSSDLLCARRHMCSQWKYQPPTRKLSSQGNPTNNISFCENGVHLHKVR